MRIPERLRALTFLAFWLVTFIAMATRVDAQAPNTVYVATYIDVQPTFMRQGIALVMQYGQESRTDSGNMREDILQEQGRTSRFVIVEAWKDQSSFGSHEKAAHTVRFRDALKDIHRGPYDQRVNHGFAIDSARETSGKGAVFVVTHVDVPAARREEAEVILERLADASWHAAGHVRYDIYQQNDPRTNHFTVVAVWNSSESFDAYGATPYALQFREAVAPLLGALYDERLYKSPR